MFSALRLRSVDSGHSLELKDAEQHQKNYDCDRNSE